jgi:hypothetical protein
VQKLFDRPIQNASAGFEYLALLLFFILAFVPGFVYMTEQDICIDEPFSIYHAQLNIPEIIQYLKPTNNPPLFEIILHYWIKVTNISPFSVRLLPVLFNACAVIYVYKTGVRFFSLGVGITAALLFCSSTHAIYYAHDCRTYSLFIFLTATTIYFTAKIIERRHSRADLIILCLLNTLMVYAHYFGFIVWFIEFIFLIIYCRNELKSVLFVFMAALILYLPQLFNLVERFLFSTAAGTWVKEPNGIESIYNVLWKFSNMPVVTVVCILVILSSLVLFFIRRNKAGSNKGKLFLTIFFIVPFLTMFLISYKIPVFNPRYLSFLLPAYYLMLSVLSADLISNKKYKFIIPFLLIGLFMITVNVDPDKKREAKATTDFVNRIKQEGDLIIICTHEFLTNYAYYTDMKLFQITGGGEYGNLETELKKRNIYAVRSINEVDVSLINSAKRIIYLDAGADFSNPGNNVLNSLNAKLKLWDKKHFEEIFNVYTFVNPN